MAARGSAGEPPRAANSGAKARPRCGHSGSGATRRSLRTRPLLGRASPADLPPLPVPPCPDTCQDLIDEAPVVQEMYTAWMRWFVAEFGFDGFRIDAPMHLHKVRGRQPDAQSEAGQRAAAQLADVSHAEGGGAYRRLHSQQRQHT